MSEIKREDLNFILQKSDVKELKNLYDFIINEHEVKILSKPTTQTLLQPIHDPISGGEFYGGEILVTSTIVSIGNSQNKGWSMVQDVNDKLSLYISVCDGAFGAGYFVNEIINLANTTLNIIKNKQNIINQKVNSTKVNFNLMGKI